MKRTISGTTLKMIGLAILSLALAADAFGQRLTAKRGESDHRLVFAINEGAAGDLTATDILFRYESFKPYVERALGVPITLVAVRNAKELRAALAKHAFDLVMSHPADALAEAVRDYGYQAVVESTEPGHAYFIVQKDSPLKTLADVRGKSIVTPDRYAYMWRIANAMLRDAKINMADEKVRCMTDQAAIGWSMQGGFFDVGVVASFSGVGRNWEKKGGRILASSPALPNTPVIASPRVSAAQIQKLRTALVDLQSAKNGPAILKSIGMPGFEEASSKSLLDLIAWLGPLDVQKPQNAGIAQNM